MSSKGKPGTKFNVKVKVHLKVIKDKIKNLGDRLEREKKDCLEKLTTFIESINKKTIKNIPSDKYNRDDLKNEIDKYIRENVRPLETGLVSIYPDDANISSLEEGEEGQETSIDKLKSMGFSDETKEQYIEIINTIKNLNKILFDYDIINNGTLDYDKIDRFFSNKEKTGYSASSSGAEDFKAAMETYLDDVSLNKPPNENNQLGNESEPAPKSTLEQNGTIEGDNERNFTFGNVYPQENQELPGVGTGVSFEPRKQGVEKLPGVGTGVSFEPRKQGVEESLVTRIIPRRRRTKPEEPVSSLNKSGSKELMQRVSNRKQAEQIIREEEEASERDRNRMEREQEQSRIKTELRRNDRKEKREEEGREETSKVLPKLRKRLQKKKDEEEEEGKKVSNLQHAISPLSVSTSKEPEENVEVIQDGWRHTKSNSEAKPVETENLNIRGRIDTIVNRNKGEKLAKFKARYEEKRRKLEAEGRTKEIEELDVEMLKLLEEMENNPDDALNILMKSDFFQDLKPSLPIDPKKSSKNGENFQGTVLQLANEVTPRPTTAPPVGKRSFILGGPQSNATNSMLYPKAGTYPPPQGFTKPPSRDSPLLKASASFSQLPNRDLQREADNFAKRSEKELTKLKNARKQAKKEVKSYQELFNHFTVSYKYEYNKALEPPIKIIKNPNVKEDTNNNRVLLNQIIKSDDKKKLAKLLIDKIFIELKPSFRNNVNLCQYFKNNYKMFKDSVGLFFKEAFGFDREQRPTEIKKFLKNTKFEDMFKFPEYCPIIEWRKGGKKNTKKNRKRNHPIKTRKNKKTKQSKKINRKKVNKKVVKKLTKKNTKLLKKKK